MNIILQSTALYIETLREISLPLKVKLPLTINI